MKIAKRQKGLQPQQNPFARALAQIPDHDAIFAEGHHDLLVHNCIADLIDEMRTQIALKQLEVLMTGRRENVGIAMQRQKKLALSDNERILILRQENITPRGIEQIGNKQTVIPTGMAVENGTGGISSQAIGIEPLQCKGFSEV